MLTSGLPQGANGNPIDESTKNMVAEELDPDVTLVGVDGVEVVGKGAHERPAKHALEIPSSLKGPVLPPSKRPRLSQGLLAIDYGSSSGSDVE